MYICTHIQAALAVMSPALFYFTKSPPQGAMTQVCMCMYVYVCMCIVVCVCVYVDIYIYICIYIYIYLFYKLPYPTSAS
jgi:hypothetical protein